MMIRKFPGIMLLSVLLCGQLFAHSGKPEFHVIIDTDGALDDMRSLSMFLSGNDIRVLAITCSQGTLLPDSVYVKVKSLLSVFHHEGIPHQGSEVDVGRVKGHEGRALLLQHFEVLREQAFPVRRQDVGIGE